MSRRNDEQLKTFSDLFDIVRVTKQPPINGVLE
jgi:hypothetical protein